MKRIYIILGIVAALLLVPLIAMQFTNEVNWDAKDFILMGGLLLFTGLGIELVLRKVKTKSYRLIICAFILFCMVLLWIELAIGIFNSPFAGS